MPAPPCPPAPRQATRNLMSAFVFVYGTLKEGFPNHHRNAGRRRAGTYRTRQPYPFYVVKLPNEDRAPWLVNRPGQGLRVSGQVFEVEAQTLRTLDAFEEVNTPTGYVRIELELEDVDDGSVVIRAQAFLRPEDHLAQCMAVEGPFDEYTLPLAVGYRLAAG